MRSNSTILVKKKKCVSCQEITFLFSKGRCRQCATIEDAGKRMAKAGSSEEKKVKPAFTYKPSSAALDRWFQERRKEMTGKCLNCGSKSSKETDWYKASVAHILPKAYFPSVATHPDNWLELCFWGDNSCHTNMDNKTLDLTEMACWDAIVTRFQRMYPCIAENEKRRIPSILLEYINA